MRLILLGILFLLLGCNLQEKPEEIVVKGKIRPDSVIGIVQADQQVVLQIHSHQDVQAYLHHELINDVYLLQAGDTLPAAFVHVENTGGILPYEVVVIDFTANLSPTDTILIKGNQLQ